MTDEGLPSGDRPEDPEAKINQLQAEIVRLQEENRDLRLALLTTAEHGDCIEAQLHRANQQLQYEVTERQRAQLKLQSLLDLVYQQKDDLEIIVQTIMEHGDLVDTQWHRKLCEANLLASSDGLTQIPNRRRFDEHLNAQWRQMAREGLSLSVILCDIDCFKQYNDSCGHLAGDDCLKLVAQALNRALNRPNDLVARYGGEEFAVVLPNTDRQGAINVAKRLQHTVYKLQIPHPSSPVAPLVTVSMGVASDIPQLERSPSDLLDQADQYLYLAKQQGRNRIVYPPCLV
jgi:diguanylate cyclase (GGDEF)-like protein